MDRDASSPWEFTKIDGDQSSREVSATCWNFHPEAASLGRQYVYMYIYIQNVAILRVADYDCPWSMITGSDMASFADAKLWNLYSTILPD